MSRLTKGSSRASSRHRRRARACLRFVLKTSALIAALALATSCAKPETPIKSPAPVSRTEVGLYLPLEDDTVLSYDSYVEDTNERGLVIFEIDRPRPELAELRIAGRVRKRYYFEPTGVRSALGGYVLKAPLSRNASWVGDDGQVKVTQVDETISVPAGKFTGCVRTVELARLPAASRTTTTVFCPRIGITWLQIEADGEGTHVLERLQLKSFGARFGGN